MKKFPSSPRRVLAFKPSAVLMARINLVNPADIQASSDLSPLTSKQGLEEEPDQFGPPRTENRANILTRCRSASTRREFCEHSRSNSSPDRAIRGVSVPLTGAPFGVSLREASSRRRMARFEVIEAEAHIVRLIFAWCWSGSNEPARYPSGEAGEGRS